MTGIGVTLPLPGIELAEHRTVVDALTAAGLDEIWTGEVDGVDGVTQLGLYRGWSPSISVGVGILNVYTRTAPLLAMTAASLGEIAPGASWLGLGSGSDVIVERWNGVPFTRPFDHVRDALRFTRAALAGEPTPATQTLAPGAFKLSRRPASPPKLALAALGPRMQRLAAEEADGVILNFVGAGDLNTIATTAADAAATRVLEEPCRRIVRLFVVPGDDAAAEVAARRHIAGYLTVDVYARFQRWLGRATALEPLWQAWSDGDRKAAVAAIPDAVVDELVLTGSPDRVAEGIDRYRAAGADSITLLPLAPHGRELPTDELTAFLVNTASHLNPSPHQPPPQPFQGDTP